MKILLFSEVTTNFNYHDYPNKWIDEETGVEYYSYFEENDTETIRQHVESEKRLLKSWHNTLLICYEKSKGKKTSQIKQIFRDEFDNEATDYPSYDGGFILEKIQNWSDDRGLLYFIHKNGTMMYKSIEWKMPFLKLLNEYLVTRLK